MLASLVSISLGAILVNNFIFSQFLGLCPFLGVSNKMSTATGMSVAVIFVMTMASAICWIINEYLLLPLDREFMQTVAYILVIAVLVQFVEMFLKKAIPSLYSAMGIFLPLITTNCAVLGVVLLNTQNYYNFLESVVYGFTGGLGFTLAIVLFSSVRERLEFADYPKAFEGFAICLVAAALFAVAFLGCSGLHLVYG
ncbi:MAG: electron transport complex subunit RsxA, partial [Clostridiales bacterium]|nr:electron transport complex subunit RsxA [Clostridiales bacterium]